MLEKTTAIGKLIANHVAGVITEEEERRLQNWVSESDHNKELFAEMTDEKYVNEQLAKYRSIDTEAEWKRIKSRQKKRPNIFLRILRGLRLNFYYFTN